MSAPAREVVEPAHPVTSPARRPSTVPAAALAGPSTTAPSRARPSARGAPPRRARGTTRRAFHPAFWIMTAALVTGMIVGLASLSAMLVQTSFRVDELEATIATERDAHEELTVQVASRSSPSRIATWALGRGMVMPDEVVVVQVPGPTRGAGGAE
jgi:cell division protein FtsL